jgi:hypothetical protein
VQNVVGVATAYRAEGQGFRAVVLVRASVSPVHVIQTGSGPH